MSKELELKSGTAVKPVRRPKMVRMLHDVQFFGVNGAQVSEGMLGIHLEWRPDIANGVVVVTSDHHKGEKWLFPAGIQHISWEKDES
jgi:hypothetical protein